MLRTATALVTCLFSVTALAQDNCPPLIELVDEILEMANDLGLDRSKQEEIRELRAQAIQHRDAGDDRQCVITIDRALAIIEGR
jgi:hypothetical protein